MENNNGKFIWRTTGAFLIAAGLVVIYIKRSPDMATAGQAGDSFNGLLAPFISFAGAVLVYLSFKAQIRANELITDQWTVASNLEILRDVKESFEKIDKPSLKQTLSLAFLLEATEETLPHIKKLEYIFIELTFLLNRIKNAEADTQHFIRLKLELFYESEVKEFATLFTKRFKANDFKAGQFNDLNAEIQKFLSLYPRKTS